MKDRIRGRVRINARGRNIYGFINAIHSGHLCCFGQYCSGGVYYAEIYRRDLGTIRELAEKHSVELEYAEYETLSAKLRRYRLRIGLLIGALAAFVMTVYFSNVVVTIDVIGNTNVTDEAVISELAALGVTKGTPMGSIDFDRCETALRLYVDGISWVGMRHTGSRLVVELTEIVPKPEMMSERVPCNVVSSRDAVITSVSVHDGQLMHKVGDFVPEGTMLISGVVGDDKGHTTIHHAMGKITGLYTQTVTFTAPRVSEEYVPTGNTDTERSLELFSLSIPLSFGRSGYKSEQRETSPHSLYFLGRELPIGVKKTVISETKLSAEERSDGELEKILNTKIYLYEKNFLGDVRIADRRIVPKKSGDALSCEVTYSLEGDICRESDIFLR